MTRKKIKITVYYNKNDKKSTYQAIGWVRKLHIMFDKYKIWVEIKGVEEENENT